MMNWTLKRSITAMIFDFDDVMVFADWNLRIVSQTDRHLLTRDDAKLTQITVAPCINALPNAAPLPIVVSLWKGCATIHK
jgi:hypothetical protein